MPLPLPLPRGPTSGVADDGVRDGGQFVWTTGICARSLPRDVALDPVIESLADEVGRRFRQFFPEHRSYRHERDVDQGRIRGQRFRVDRAGFHGTVSVMWYARSHSYRHERDGGIEVRIGGQVKLLPVVTRRPHLETDPHGGMRAVGLVAAVLLVLAAVRGIALVQAQPTLLFVVDVLGVAACLLAFAAAIVIARASFRGARLWWERHEYEVASATAYADELARWSALGDSLRTLRPRADPTAPTRRPERRCAAAG